MDGTCPRTRFFMQFYLVGEMHWVLDKKNEMKQRSVRFPLGISDTCVVL